MTDLKSLLAERRKKIYQDKNLYQQSLNTVAYVDLLEKVIERQNAALNQIAHTQDVAREDKNGGPNRFDVAMSRNRRIIEASDALSEVRRMLTEEIK